MKISKRIIAWIVCFVCCVTLLTGIIPGNAAAAESIRVHGDGELTIDYQYEGKSVAGTQFQIYRVADLSDEGEMTLAGAFAEYPVELNGLTSDEFQAAAHTLYGYALLDNVTPDYTVVTDQDGLAKLDPLPVGVYLVAAQDVEMEGGKLICDPMLVTLPSKVSQEDDWNYILTIKPKCEFEEDEEEKEPKKIKVLKRWVDGGSEERPASVTVYLLRNGLVHDTVVLSKANNWRHTWEDLDPDAHWMVVEKIPEDYLVTIHKYGITYVINNYREPEITIPTIPSIPTEPEETTVPTEPEETTVPTEPEETTIPTEPEETTIPTEPEETTVPTEPEETTVPTEPEETTVPTEPEPTEPDIPQTGMLWWPVPLLAVAGLILMLAGVLLRCRSHEDA